MRVRRSSLHFLRSEIHRIEKLIPVTDRAKIERNLAANACVLLWDFEFRRVLACLRRLVLVSPAVRQDHWRGVMTKWIQFMQNPEIKFEARAA